MGWTSYNDFINLTTNSGTIGNAIWQKSFGAATGVAPFPSAGRWYNMGYYQGNPMVSRYGERLLNGYGQFMGNANGWTLNGIYWTYASNTIVCAIGGTATATIMPTNMTAGARYGIEFTLSNYSGSGNFVVSLGGTTAATVAANGTYFQVIVTSNNTGPLTITPAATVGGSFSNISVVQMNTGVPLMSTDMGALQVGGTVSPSTKHIVFAGLAAQNANMVPGTWKLVDVLMSYPIDMNLVGFQNFVPIGGNYSVAFQNGAGAWTYGSGWAYSSATTVTASSPSGMLSLPVANMSTPPYVVTQNAPIVNYVYNITFTISAFSGGTGTIMSSIGGGNSTATTLANGTFTQFVTATNTTGALSFSVTTLSGTPSFSLTMLPMQVIPAFQNGVGAWTYGSGWSYTSASSVTATAASSSFILPIANMNAGTTPIIGYQYVLTFNLASNATNGTLTVSFGGVTANAISVTSTSGLQPITYSLSFIPTNTTGALTFAISSTSTVVLSNVTMVATVSASSGSGVYVGLPRYSTGANVKAMLCWHSGTWINAGNATSAAVHYMQLDYTNDTSVAGLSTPSIVAGFSGAVPNMGHIDNSGVVAWNVGPFFPLQNTGVLNSDSGMQSVQGYSSTAATGLNNYANLILCRELCTIPNPTVYVPSERDFMNQLHSLPQIQDGANLQWLFMCGTTFTVANNTAFGWLDYAWGT